MVLRPHRIAEDTWRRADGSLSDHDRRAAQDEHAVAAVQAFVRAATVGVMIGTRGSDPVANGSGTLLRVGERFVVLTAAHVARADAANSADDGKRHLVRVGLPDALYDFVDGEPMFHRESELARYFAIDVAVMLVRREHEAALRAIEAPESDRIAIGSDAAVGEDDLLAAAGYPRALRMSDGGASLHPPLYSAPSIRIGCTCGQHPRDSLHLDWGGSAIEADTNRMLRVPDPGGMSGAGVWRMPNKRGAEFWAPTAVARLVGVVASYDPNRNCVHAASAVDWGGWVAESVASLVARNGIAGQTGR